MCNKSLLKTVKNVLARYLCGERLDEEDVLAFRR